MRWRFAPKGCTKRYEFISETATALLVTFINGNRDDVRSALKEMEEESVAFAILALMMERATLETRQKITRYLVETA